jgi:hypothetical protein
MKTPEDEAFEDIERRQGGGFPAKRAMAADKFIAAEERKVGERYGYVPKLHPSEWMDESAQDGKCKYCVDGCVACDARAQPAQEPVEHLWECLGRWSAYLVCNGKQADCAPPSWLVEAIQNATTPPRREWVGLTDEDRSQLVTLHHGWNEYAQAIEAKLKEKNG